ncbi:MAG: family 43 glycosylhydrolase, partial [Lachnospiraceae bacterium]|nr:family 43 glycosylhydrolase [Lachnospiraceae bacterium]
AGRGYEAARCAVAVSDVPAGPFKFVRSGRVNPGIYPANMQPKQVTGQIPDEWWTEDWYKLVDKGAFVERDLDGGQMSRDMTIFVDEDGKAYHVYSSEENLTLQIAELNDDYTAHTGKYIRIFPGGHNEAPVVFKHGGKYWMVTSGCTGWAPNKARMMWADDMLGEWHMAEGTPCIGPESEITFGGQGAYCANIGGKLVFMADRWTPKCLAGSGSLWLPILFNQKGEPVIPYLQAWQ